jgi:hypothetical protein
MNTYHAFYKGKKIELETETSYAAQVKAAEMFKAKKSFEVDVILVAKNGEPVTHLPLF